MEEEVKVDFEVLGLDYFKKKEEKNVFQDFMYLLLIQL